MPVKDVHSDGLSCFASRKSWFSQLLGHARGPDCKVLPYAYIHDLTWGSKVDIHVEQNASGSRMMLFVLQPLCWQLVGCSDLLSGVLRCVRAQAVFEQRSWVDFWIFVTLLAWPKLPISCPEELWRLLWWLYWLLPCFRLYWIGAPGQASSCNVHGAAKERGSTQHWIRISD